MLQRHTGKQWHSLVYLAGNPAEVAGALPDLYLQGLGRFESRGRFRHRQVAPSFVVHVVAEGSGVMESDGRRFEVNAGDLFAFFPGQYLYYYDGPETPWRYTWFILDGIRAEAVMAHCGLDREHPYRRGGAQPGLGPVFGDAEAELGRPDVSPAAAAALAWRLVRELEPRNAPLPRPTLAERARVLFDHHYGEPLTVEAIADHLGVSRATLFRAFRAEYGRSPKSVFDELRMERATHLLQASSESLKEIAAVCGYASEAYFSRAFKARLGLPPGQWRRAR